MGLTLAHQNLRQLRTHEQEVLGAILGNAYTRVVFRVGEDDARTLAAGFAHFEATDLQTLHRGAAIARIERSDADFNLTTHRASAVASQTATERISAVMSQSRRRYGTERMSSSEHDDSGRSRPAEGVPPEPSKTRARRSAKQQNAVPDSAIAVDMSLPGRGGPQHKYLQSLVKRLAEDRGFQATIEQRVLEGHGHVDVALQYRDLSIACEISVSTRIDHEIGNLAKCLAAGFQRAVLICADEQARVDAISRSDGQFRGRIDVITAAQSGEFLALSVAREEPTASGHRTSRRYEPQSARDGASRSRVSSADSVEADRPPKRLLIARDAAAYIGLAQQTLAKLRVVGGSPPYFKVGRQVLYDEAVLDLWLDRRRRISTSDSDGATRM